MKSQKLACALFISFILLLTNIALGGGAAFDSFLNAVMRGDVEAVQASLNNGMNANESGAQGYNAFHLAAFFGHEAIIDLFIREHHVENINVPGHNLNTALHLAAGGGHGRVVERLLQEDNLNVTVPNNDGITPYHMAAGLERGAVRTLLLNDPREQANGEQDAANFGLHRAGRRVYIYAVERILAYPQRDLGDAEWAELLDLYETNENKQAADILRQAGLELEATEGAEVSDNDNDDDDFKVDVVVPESFLVRLLTALLVLLSSQTQGSCT